MKYRIFVCSILILLGNWMFMIAEDAELYFRENWKKIPAEVPVTQQHVQNPELILERHGPGASLIKESHHDEIPGDP